MEAIKGKMHDRAEAAAVKKVSIGETKREREREREREKKIRRIEKNKMLK